MTILVTGSKGMLGRELVAELSAGHEIIGVDIDRCDITDYKAVENLLGEVKPALVVHAAAFTDVEEAETQQDKAFAVNSRGAGNVARASRTFGAGMFMISTDYVFDGAKQSPYLESDIPHPINIYGQSKLKGEKLSRKALPSVTVIRTAWLYGAGGNNFLSKILHAAVLRKKIAVVTDEVGSPTYAVDLAAGIRQLIERGASRPLYHLSGGGSVSRYDLVKELFSILKIDNCQLEPTTRDKYPALARRPANSALESEFIGADGFSLLRPWPEALRDFAEKNLKQEWRNLSRVRDERKQ
jgi:dTDP-4-dehydrorhamnose reductase